MAAQAAADGLAGASPSLHRLQAIDLRHRRARL
jgi:hypothetical protein